MCEKGLGPEIQFGVNEPTADLRRPSLEGRKPYSPVGGPDDLPEALLARGFPRFATPTPTVTVPGVAILASPKPLWPMGLRAPRTRSRGGPWVTRVGLWQLTRPWDPW